MDRYVYMSAADRQLENYLDEDAFDKSLILNILFQHSVLIPDIYFFISRGLERHVLTTSESLLESAVGNGIAIPKLRDPDKSLSSFIDVLHVLRGKGDERNAIQGIRLRADEIAIRLQSAVDRHGKVKLDYWPNEDIGVGYKGLVEQYLGCTQPPEVGVSSGIILEELGQIWKLTERWRVDCVAAAAQETKARGELGLRRGDLMNAVGHSLGLPSDYKVDDIAELFSRVKSPKEGQALRLFCRWMCELYQYNQAKKFGAIPNFPQFDLLSGAVTASLLPRRSSLINLSHHPTITVKVVLPPWKLLLRVPPSELLEIRNEHNADYLAKLMAWQEHPTEANERRLRDTLHHYGKAIVKGAEKKYERDFREETMEIIFGASPTPSRDLLAAIVKWVGASTLFFIGPSVATFVVMGVAAAGTVYQAFRWRGYERMEEEIEIETPLSEVGSAPEVNLPITSKEA